MRVYRIESRVVAGMVVSMALLWPNLGHAGIDECNNVRLEDALGCELRGSFGCEAGCEKLGVYERACATKLHTVCREECVLDPEPTCTDECTEQCSSDCDIGVNVVCSHNCFAECSGSCGASCANANDNGQCIASCEATCDAECDIKCEPLVDGSCYEHCVECCGGTCTAKANMDCQTRCQEEEFTSCEYDFEADCEASCSGEGALFCDGDFVISGKQLPSCVNALLSRGILSTSVGLNAGLGEIGDAVDSAGPSTSGKASAPASCALSGADRGEGMTAALSALFVALVYRRKRR